MQHPPLLLVVATAVLFCLPSLEAQETHGRVCVEGKVRLVNGTTPREGRVEVCQLGVWGTVCDDLWGGLDARVVCRQLGFAADGARAARGGIFSPGVGAIHMDNVQCSGGEESIINCSRSGQLDCRHFEDAGVFCEEPGFSCNNGDIRLGGGANAYEGRVEYCLANTFGTICDDITWDDADAQVVCNQLGYLSTPTASAISIGGGNFGRGSGVIHLSGLECTGDEPSLSNCSIIQTSFSIFCSHSFDVGVLCPSPNPTCENGDVRLVNGRILSEGRVEVCYNDHWGTVCHDGWGPLEAQVVCRELNYSTEGAIPITFSDFGEGDGLILLANVNCTGDEANLAECPHVGIAQFFCTHAEDSGVVCPDEENACETGAVRLMGGKTFNEGRLEVCFLGHWGTVCDDRFDNLDAAVVCRQLGLPAEGAITFPLSLYGAGVGVIFLDDVACVGNETRLEDCFFPGEIGESNCLHIEDVSILCPSNETRVCDNEAVRLVGGNGNYSGRVEVCFNNAWGTVCDDDWDRGDAEVVCKQLGFNPMGSVALGNAFFGEGSGPIFLDDTNCSPENHTTLIQCFTTSDVGENNCRHSEDASVICSFDCEDCNCTNGDIRLRGGPTELVGRVEVCIEGVWGTICSNFWNNLDAAVACKQLEYAQTDAVAVTDGSYGPGTGPIFADSFLCRGTEGFLLDCYHERPQGGTCSHLQDVGVQCSEFVCNNGDIRLVNGRYESDGRLEICFNQRFGAICDVGFDRPDATVACRQLGFDDGQGAIALPSGFFGLGPPITTSRVRCDGSEARLTECIYNVNGFCFPTQVASVLCQSNNVSCANGEFRLADSSDPHQGRLEVCFNGHWGSVCQVGWTNIDALTVCSILGYTDSPHAISTAGGYFGIVDGPIFLQNVNCSGRESNLLQCLVRNPGDTSCRHSQDIGVVCPVSNGSYACQSGDIRLVDGANEYQGRVELCINGVWGTVCDDFWGDADARVVCNQLGFGTINATAQGTAFYGQGSGPIYLDNVQCTGSERHIMECNSIGVGSFCFHSEDAGVKCRVPPEPLCIDGDIKLVGGEQQSEGTIQICVNAAWGTVCDDFWDSNDAAVACRQLGFEGEGAIALRGAHFGEGEGRIFLDNVDCIGNESALLDCDYVPPFCAHFEDAGVICPIPEDVNSNCTTGDVRLVGGDTEYKGRVEVCIHGRWGTVCDDGWDSVDARVVCNQLGLTAPGLAYGVGGALFGFGQGLIFLDEVNCTGNESSLLECRSLDLGQHNCDVSEDAGVFCPNPTAVCTNGEVRLRGGTTEYEGTVEVCLDGVWGSVCADFLWDDRGAEVVCRQLGFPFENAVAVGDAVFGETTGPIYLSGLDCSGTEDSLLFCPTFSSFFFSIFCQDHSQDAGVVCSAPDVTCADGDVRLMDGSTSNEGRVEICYNNHWGTVCDDSWDNQDASVVCRQAGFPAEGALAIPRAFFGSGFGRIHLDDLECEGNEDALINCSHNGIREHNCGHAEDAGAICIVPNPACEHGDLRFLSPTLPTNNEQLAGTLEICFAGNWGTICDDFWDNNDATVACRQLGFHDQGAIAVTRARYGQGTGPIFLDDTECRGNESRIADCRSDGIAVHNCGHSEDAGAICKPIPCTNGTLRLSDGFNPSNGRLEICVSEVWATVCGSGFTDTMAAAVCTNIGLPAEGSFRSAEGLFARPPNSRPIYNLALCGPDQNCTFSVLTPSPSCTHDNDIGVLCPAGEVDPSVCTSGKIRLEGGNDEREGRVEICINDQWGTICDDSWDERGVNLVCSTLFNTEGVGEMLDPEEFPDVDNLPILMDDVKCRGSESNLLSCPQLQLNTTHDCTHMEDVAITCTGVRRCQNGEIRLSGGQYKSEGTIQICLNGVWGTVCDDLWVQTDATVVCNSLGYNGSAIALRGAHFGQGSGPIHLDNVICTGDELSLLNCGYSPHNCGHSEDAGVICPIPEDVDANCTNGDIRLADGENQYQGRVEVCLHGNWGTVCDDSWDNRDARVVCNQLGFTAGFPSSASNAAFGPGSGLIFLDNVNCVGTEPNLLQCRGNEPGIHNCGHSEDAGVYCPDPTANCTNGDVRLVGGATEYEGRVELCVGGAWGTVCGDSFWDDKEASVVCRQLGFLDQYAIAVRGAAYGPGEGRILIRTALCNGSESALLNCRYSTPSPFSFFCNSHSRDASVVCQDPTFRCNSTEVRLSGGATSNEGRVEICLDNHWGTLCDNGWDLPDAQVVCRQLRYRTEGVITTRARTFGEGFGRVHLDNLNCSGSEERLYDCGHSSFTQVRCFTFESDVGVICPVGDPVCTHGDLRLQDGRTSLEGRVEICIGGTWGSVCDDLWDDRDASVVCSQLGFSRIGADAIRPRLFPMAAINVPIFLDNLQCVGTETTLLDCRANPVATHNCGHSEDAGIVCRPRPCTDGTLRLSDGFNPSNGRLEICVSEVWATVCGSGFTDTMAAAACTNIGLPAEGAFRSAEGLFARPSTETPIYSVGMDCNGRSSCTFTVAATSGLCTHDNDIGVFCPAGGVTPTVCTTGEMRLGGTFLPREGRVEICINNVWGTICDDSWNQHSVNFVCNSIYNQSVVGELVDASEYTGGEDLPILMDDVKCTGRESNLLSCPQLQLSAPHDCTHMEDVAISCTGTRRCADGEILLSGGQYPSEGTIQICVDNVWGTVCDDLWDQADATVVCNRLGYTNGSAIALRGAHFGQGDGPIHLDNVICTGDELSLLNCGYSPHNCGHFEDAGVICPIPEDVDANCTNGDIRLVNGDNQYQGRVEVCLHGNWGTVCDDSWDSRDARVVCNQLGYTAGYAFGATNAAFGRGSGLIFLDNVNCVGTEPNLLQCRGNEPGNHNCGPSEDAGVYCPDPTANCTNGDVRLVGGTTESEGRVEVCVGGAWGTVCGDSFWDDREASVVCRQLGFLDQYAVAVGGAAYGPGVGRVFLQTVLCNGSESALFSCRFSSPSIFSFRCSSHINDASVVCQDPTFRCNSTEVRLSDGATRNEGRVEICLDNHWGTLCDNGWDLPDAQVVCRQLGYRAEGAITTRARTFGEGFGRVHLDNLNCSGSEERLYDCGHSSFTQVSCFTFESDVGVICPDGDPVCTHGDLRLQDGRTSLDGRVEICIGGTWGSVCDDLWDDRDASVVCSQLGHSRIDADAASYRSFPVAAANVPIFLDNLQCVGTETSLLDCRANPVATHNCGHHEDAGVHCQTLPCANGDVRISGGLNVTNGWVEVCYNQLWGTVCDVGLNQSIAADICEKANFSREGAIIGAPGLFMAASDTPIYTSDTLGGNYKGSSTPDASCTHANDMIVFCAEEEVTGCMTGDIRLAGVQSSQTEGRLEVCLNGEWGTVCDDSWHVTASAVTCNLLGMYGGEAIGANGFGDAEDLPILMDDVKCEGSESSLLSCPQLPLVMEHNCAHSEDVAIRCTEKAECDEGAVRLAGGSGPTEGRVEICQWGLWTSVCANEFWSNDVAETICKQMDYIGGVPNGRSFYGRGSGSTILSPLSCAENATELSSCQFAAISARYCDSHNNDAGLSCTDPKITCTNGEVRLSGGPDDNIGRVERCMNNQWRAVCADQWGQDEATVICRQLKFRVDDVRATPEGFYSDGNIEPDSGGYECPKDAQTLDSCTTQTTDTACNSSAAGVICHATGSGCVSGTLRLVGGSSEMEGRLQVCMGGTWGSVCDSSDTWGPEETTVACQRLGFSEKGASEGTSYYSGEVSGPILLDNTQCIGSEYDLLQCSSSAASGRCDHSQDIGLSCPARQCTEGAVRLAGGSAAYLGRLEVCRDSQWGTVCAGGDDPPDPFDICKDLKYSGDFAILTSGGFFGEGSGPQFGSLAGNDAPDSCTHKDDVGVICNSPNTDTGCRAGRVRLANDKIGENGARRVEVCFDAEWGTVCNDTWDNQDAVVVCQQLHMEYKAATAQTVPGGNGEVLLSSMKCSGKEDNLLSCPQSPLGTINHCGHDRDAGVICTNTAVTGGNKQKNNGGSSGGSGDTAWVVVAILLIIILIVVAIVAVVLGVLYYRHRKAAGGKLIFTDRSQPDHLPFVESVSYSEGLSSAPEESEPEKTEL